MLSRVIEVEIGVAAIDGGLAAIARALLATTKFAWKQQNKMLDRTDCRVAFIAA